jgi:histidinol-phosphatase (PHP family)
MWANLHTHCTYCDGKTGIGELVEEAKQQNLISLGVSSHAPLPFDRGWAMKKERFNDYLRELDELKHKNRQIQLYSGLEVDFIPGKISPADYQHRLDYTIGSIHFVEQLPDGTPWEIDNTKAVFMDGLSRIYDGNIREAVTRYFELTRQMIRDSKPDVVGHLDKIKIQNTGDRLFNESESWYKQQVEETLRAIADSGVIVEVNTRGIYQKKAETTYPSPWIVRRMKELNVAVTISSDAHHPKDLTNCFTEAATVLLSAGYTTIHTLHDHKWKSFRFDEGGIIR